MLRAGQIGVTEEGAGVSIGPKAQQGNRDLTTRFQKDAQFLVVCFCTGFDFEVRVYSKSPRCQPHRLNHGLRIAIITFRRIYRHIAIIGKGQMRFRYGHHWIGSDVCVHRQGRIAPRYHQGEILGRGLGQRAPNQLFHCLQ